MLKLALLVGFAVGLVMVLGCAKEPPEVTAQMQSLCRLKMEFVREGPSEFHACPSEHPMAAELFRAEAVPMLIAHLDDPTPTNTTYVDSGAPCTTPLGFLCLDALLLLSAKDSPAVKPGCHGKDCPWEMAQPEYFYMPNVLLAEDGLARMKQVRKQWAKAYKAQTLRFLAQGSPVVAVEAED